MPKEKEKRMVRHIEASERKAGKSAKKSAYIARARVYGRKRK